MILPQKIKLNNSSVRQGSVYELKTHQNSDKTFGSYYLDENGAGIIFKAKGETLRESLEKTKTMMENDNILKTIIEGDLYITLL